MGELIKIQAPALSNVSYGENLAKLFDAINTNFENIASTSFLKGPQGDSIENVEITLGDENETGIYINDKNQTGIDFLNSLKEAVLEYFRKPGETNQPYELGDIVIKDVEGLEDEVITWDKYLAGSKIIMVCAKDNSGVTKKLIPVSSMIFVLRDARYDVLYKVFEANKLKPEIHNKYEWYENLVDVSSAMQFDSETGKFVRFMAFPTIYYDINRDNFCWKINGNKTGLTATGPKGPKGEDGKCWIVLVKGARDANDDFIFGKNIYMITKVLTFKVVNGLVIYEFIDYLNNKESNRIEFGDESTAIVFKENSGGSIEAGTYWISPILYKGIGISRVPVVHVDDSMSIKGLLTNIAFMEMMRHLGPTKTEISNGVQEIIPPGLFVPTNNSISLENEKALQKAHTLFAVNKINNDPEKYGVETPIKNLQQRLEVREEDNRDWDCLILSHTNDIFKGFPQEVENNWDLLTVNDFFVNYNTHFKGNVVTIDDDKQTMFVESDKIGYKIAQENNWEFKLGIYNNEYLYKHGDGLQLDLIGAVGKKDEPGKIDYYYFGRKPMRQIDPAKNNIPIFNINYETGKIGINKLNPVVDVDIVGNMNISGAVNIGSSNNNTGDHAFVHGLGNEVSGKVSYSEGRDNKAIGEAAHTEGAHNEAHGDFSHAEGYGNITKGLTSHAEGGETLSLNRYTHAEGRETIASGEASHAEGYGSEAIGIGSHAEGGWFGEDKQTSLEIIFLGGTAFGNASHAEGRETIASGEASHAEGIGSYENVTITIDPSIGPNQCFLNEKLNEHTTLEQLDDIIKAGALIQINDKFYGFLEVLEHMHYSYILNDYIDLTAEQETEFLSKPVNIAGKLFLGIADGESSHTEGMNNVVTGKAAHAEGQGNKSLADSSHTEGNNNTTNSLHSHAEGQGNTVTGLAGHAEGFNNIVHDTAAHAEGFNTQAHNEASHAEGNRTNAYGESSHAEGHDTMAGYKDKEIGFMASGRYSHAEGYGTITLNTNEHAEGKFNISIFNDNEHPDIPTQFPKDYKYAEGDSKKGIKKLCNSGNATTLSTIGFGTSDDDRRNAFSVSNKGHVHIYGLNGYNGKGGTYENSLQCALTNLVGKKYGEQLDSKTKDNFTIGGRDDIILDTDEDNNNNLGEIFNDNGNEAPGQYSHAEGQETKATGSSSHAEGNLTIAEGEYSHAEGKESKAKNTSSHAEGYGTEANSMYSHTEGFRTKTSNPAEHASGKHNITRTGDNKSDKTIFTVGIGDTDLTRLNALEIREDGNVILDKLTGMDKEFKDGTQKYLSINSKIGFTPEHAVDTDGFKKPVWSINTNGDIDSDGSVNVKGGIVADGDIKTSQNLICNTITARGFVGSNLMNIVKILADGSIPFESDYVIIKGSKDVKEVTVTLPKEIIELNLLGKTIYISSEIKCNIKGIVVNSMLPAARNSYNFGNPINISKQPITIDRSSITLVYIGDNEWSVFYATYNSEAINNKFTEINNNTVQVKNLRTINGQSLINNSGTGNPGDINTNNYVDTELSKYYTKQYIDDELNKKQNVLLPGVNIRTINGAELTGSGNIVIEGVNVNIEGNNKTPKP